MRAERHFDGRVVRCFADRPKSTFALLGDAIRANSEGEAIVSGDERLSYRAFERVVNRWAVRLENLGVACGDRVAILLGNGVAFPAVLFAAARLGAIAVPISIREQTPGLAYMLDNCGAKVLVHEADLAARLPVPSATPQLQHRIALSSDAPEGGLERLESAVAPPAVVSEEDPAVILYTSGTTGRPKGAMLTHLGICHSAMHYECCMGLTARDRSVVAVPMSHVTGVVALIAGLVRAAGTLIVMRTFKAAEFLVLAERERMTHTLLVPAMYNLCLLEPRFPHADLSCWRVGGYGGAPMASATIARIAEKLPQLQLMNAYGATETTSPATLMPPTETAARPDSVGMAVPCGEVLVMDDNGREVPHGETGEIWLRGPMVVKGYWDNPQATAESFVAGYWRSGDIGSIDSQGYVRVFDRKKDVVNRGGYKIYTIEVENVLIAHPEVIEAAVIPRACPVLGERAHAVVCLKRADVTTAELTRHCAAQLADYKVPDTFSFRTDPLPRNANGKVMKRDLKDELSKLLGLS
ncbi:MAG: class I adenylate-forming enzyme family protein [Hyphomicrobiaceae bacterium]